MFSVTATIDFCYGHRLLHYEGKCAHLHGHNGRAEVELRGTTLDRRSMVADFADIDRAVRSWIDENLDHRLLLHRDDPLVQILRRQDEPVFLMDTDPTAESIAKLIFEIAASRGLPVSSVRLWETATSVATYAPAPS